MGGGIMLFDTCKNSKHQGSIGETRAIHEYTKLGYIVSKPICDCDYDLIVDDGCSLKRVQVKTTKNKRRGTYICNLRVMGGNQSFNVVKNRNPDSWDILFVLTENENCWSIPSNKFDAVNSLTLDSRFDCYKI